MKVDEIVSKRDLQSQNVWHIHFKFKRDMGVNSGKIVKYFSWR